MTWGVRLGTRCTLYNDRMGGEFREGKRGKKGVCAGGGGGGSRLCFCRGHTKNRNRTVNLAQQRKRKKKQK